MVTHQSFSQWQKNSDDKGAIPNNDPNRGTGRATGVESCFEEILRSVSESDRIILAQVALQEADPKKSLSLCVNRELTHLILYIKAIRTWYRHEQLAFAVEAIQFRGYSVCPNSQVQAEYYQ